VTGDEPIHYDLVVYAEYSQFYLSDDDILADTASPAFWSQDALQRRLAVAPPGLIGVGTATYDDVAVSLDVVDLSPGDDFDGWDQVVEASLQLNSGQLKIAGPLPHAPDVSFRVNVVPGTYRVRVYYGGLRVPGAEHYHIVMWRETTYDGPLILHAQTQP